MKEYDENEAIRLMSDTLAADRRDNDSVCEVLDLIYDFYDENGDLDIDSDDDSDPEVDEIVEYISRFFAKNAPAVLFTDSELRAMVEAEIRYEESLI